METITQFGRVWVVAVAVALALIARRLWLALDLAVAGVGAYFASNAAKHWIGRGRPADLLTHVITRSGPFHGAGYPSGHSAVAAGLAAVLVPYVPRGLRRWVWALAVMVGVSRVYLGAHFPLDVVGGLALGLVGRRAREPRGGRADPRDRRRSRSARARSRGHADVDARTAAGDRPQLDTLRRDHPRRPCAVREGDRP